MWQTELWSSYEQLRGRQFALTFKTIPQLLCFDCWHRQPWHLLIHLTHWVVSEARVTLDTRHDRRRSLSGCFYTLTAALNFLRYSRYLGTKMLQCCGILMVSNLPAPWCKACVISDCTNVWKVPVIVGQSALSIGGLLPLALHVRKAQLFKNIILKLSQVFVQKQHWFLMTASTHPYPIQPLQWLEGYKHNRSLVYCRVHTGRHNHEVPRHNHGDARTTRIWPKDWKPKTTVSHTK